MNRKIFKIQNEIESILGLIFLSGLIIYLILNGNTKYFMFFITLPLLLLYLCLFFLEFEIFKEKFRYLNWQIFRYKNYERIESKYSGFDIIFSWILFFIYILYIQTLKFFISISR